MVALLKQSVGLKNGTSETFAIVTLSQKISTIVTCSVIKQRFSYLQVNQTQPKWLFISRCY